MAYCTNAHVAGEFKKITFDSNSPVTDTEVDRFIAEADAEIDSKLSTRYEVPITGSTALILVRQISIWLVAARVKEILQVKTGGAEQVEQITRLEDLREEAYKLMNDIVSGKVKLTDATLATSDDGMTSYLMNEDITYDYQTGEDAW